MRGAVLLLLAMGCATAEPAVRAAESEPEARRAARRLISICLGNEAPTDGMLEQVEDSLEDCAIPSSAKCQHHICTHLMPQLPPMALGNWRLMGKPPWPHDENERAPGRLGM